MKVGINQNRTFYNLSRMNTSIHRHFRHIRLSRSVNHYWLLKSSSINVSNCITIYVNCSALTGAYDWQWNICLSVCLFCGVSLFQWHVSRDTMLCVLFLNDIIIMCWLTHSSLLRIIFIALLTTLKKKHGVVSGGIKIIRNKPLLLTQA